MFPHLVTWGGKEITNLEIRSIYYKQYYKHRLMICGGEMFNTIHRMGRLFQQYVVDIYSKIEEGRLNFIRGNQSKIQAELYQGLEDVIQSSDGTLGCSQIGKKIILPSTFTGGARYQHQLYQDVMGIVHVSLESQIFS